MKLTITDCSISQRVERLRQLRESGVRSSEEVIRLIQDGTGILSAFGLPTQDDIWDIYEQVAIAALDTGRLELATKAIKRLESRFPGSTRVSILHGMLLEARGDLITAKEYYENELSRSNNGSKTNELTSIGEANIRIRKRLIALHLNQPPLKSDLSIGSDQFSLQTGIKLLVELLDSIYSDPEGWLQLAEAYASIGLYEQSLAALEDLIFIQPDNTFHLLRYAETAYTTGEYELAYKTYLRIIELSGPISEEVKGGPCRRAAVGVRLCLERLPRTEKSNSIKEIICDELDQCYSKDWVPLQPGLRVSSETCRRVTKKWIEG
ncbi:hypothetical protein BY996DRAFT_4590450 [Phakopsora pachyrhizi]|nr:hypothetical protein BY996DRAFT_4590450 [Phakopsora pachyrhizi]